MPFNLHANFTNMTKHIYNNPSDYCKNNALQYNFAMTALSSISFSTNSRILDIGCGDGIITNEIAKIVHGGCVIGTDISMTMVEHASKTYRAQKNLRFLQMDAEENFFREQFDIITSFNCLHWIKNHESALRGISNAGVDGAQILLLLSHRKSKYHAVLDKICTSNKWKFWFVDYINPRSFFDQNIYKQMIMDSGLSIVSMTEEEMTHFYETKDQLKAFFNSAGSQPNRIPDELKNEFLDDFADEFFKETQSLHHKQIPVSFWCLQIVATK